ncbi:hypothetical protein B0H10DRAFT_1957623 [Mycena sp. CBHHK59/15]|nr:hypothetical protein B0H10DRAFT_1957623 [Mycena sp. CBHHK59/15]
MDSTYQRADVSCPFDPVCLCIEFQELADKIKSVRAAYKPLSLIGFGTLESTFPATIGGEPGPFLGVNLECREKTEWAIRWRGRESFGKERDPIFQDPEEEGKLVDKLGVIEHLAIPPAQSERQKFALTA